MRKARPCAKCPKRDGFGVCVILGKWMSPLHPSCAYGRKLMYNAYVHGRVHAQALQAKEGAQEMIAKIFPVALIVLDVAAAVVYAACGDWRRFIYWIAAATLTATVTF